jgi:nitrate reductase cytochrome c-type subunit
MSRLSHYAALALFTAVVASSGASAATRHNNAAPQASEFDTRKQCYEEARTRWPSTSQDMQTNRDFAAKTCMVDHGIRNP